MIHKNCTGSHDQFGSKPAVYEQEVETDAALVGMLQHFYCPVGLLHLVFIYTLLYILTFMCLREICLTLLLSKPIHLVFVLFLFPRFEKLSTSWLTPSQRSCVRCL